MNTSTPDVGHGSAVRNDEADAGTMHAAGSFAVSRRRTEAGVTIIAVSGELDFWTGSQLRRELLAAVEQETPRILLDLEAMPFADSTGLGAIIHGYKLAKTRGGTFALAAVPANTAAMIRITGLTHLFSPYATVAEAQMALSPEAAACRP